MILNLLGQIVQTKKQMNAPGLSTAKRVVLMTALVAYVLSFAIACKGNPEPPKKLDGTVKINGAGVDGEGMEVGDELTATVTGATNGTAGKFKYDWKQVPSGDTVLIIDNQGTSNTYTITSNDVGQKISVIVTNAGTIGSITDTTTGAVLNPDRMITESFTIGGVDFTLEVSKSDTVSQNNIVAIAENYDNWISANPNGADAGAIEDLLTRESANYKIIVDYSDEGKNAGFVPTDAQTLTVGSNYLATTTLTRGILRTAFEAMFAKEWPIPAMAKAIIQNGVNIPNAREYMVLGTGSSGKLTKT
jgi:hypothetical protein